MPWIEGVGDEVTIFFAFLVFFTIIVSAWFSTGIRDIPFISVIIVQLTRRRRQRRNPEQDQQNSGVDQTGLVSEEHQEANPDNEDERTSQQETETNNTSQGETPVQAAEGVAQAPFQAPETDEISRDAAGVEKKEIVEKSDNSSIVSESTENSEHLPPTELRKRRLEFLSGKAQTCDIDSQAEREKKLESFPDSQVDVVKKTSGELNNVDTSKNSSAESEAVIHGATTHSDNTVSGQTNRTEEEDGAIRVKIKFLNDTQRQVEANLNETIGNFRRRHFSTEMSESKLVRFIYNGQDLRNDSSTLQSYNIGDNSVLHCLITQPRPEDRANPGVNEDNGLDIGVLMFPLFGLLLSIVWYLRFTYRQIFNVTSTLTLGGITFLYLAALLSSFRAQRGHEHID